MKFKEKYLSIILVIATIVMTIFRFLLNEKGRVTPDSIRYMKAAHDLPEVDNAIAPLGYPLAIKLFTFLCFDEFWSSKILGIIVLLGIILFSKVKNFYTQEVIFTSALFSFVTLFSATLSEGLTLLFVLGLFYFVHQLIQQKCTNLQAIFQISLTLIILYNIRYSSLFFIAGTGLFGLFYFRKKIGIPLIISSFIAGIYMILYKVFFINAINENYLTETLEFNAKSTIQLLDELWKGLATSFNPFIHIANPSGGIMNIGIYGIGILNILFMIFLFIRKPLSTIEKFIIAIAIVGISSTFIIQYAYWIDPLDYRLLSPFIFGLWLLYFNKVKEILGYKTYFISVLSICTGAGFTWLSKGNYLENRKEITQYLQSEKLKNKSLLFYMDNVENLEDSNLAELISTVNSDLKITFSQKDTLKNTTLTPYKVLQKIKIQKNKYQ